MRRPFTLITLCFLWLPMPAAAQTPFETLKALRVEYPTPMTQAQVGALLNRVAWVHRAGGWGLLEKGSGNSCPAPHPGKFISCDILIGGPGIPPHHWDVLVDTGGASTPAWQDKGPCLLGPSSGCAIVKFLAPIDPGDSNPPPPPPLPVPSVDLQPLLEKLDSLQDQVHGAAMRLDELQTATGEHAAFLENEIRALKAALAELQARPIIWPIYKGSNRFLGSFTLTPQP